jgi:TRAP-type mannitol/chloroaromatic compound transport system permease small subunit
MLDLIGDILNWSAAGIVFPLMVLPLAAMVGGGRSGASVWLAMTAAIAGAGVLFTALAPILGYWPSPRQSLVFFALVTALFTAVAAGGGPARATARLTPIFAAIARGAGRGVMWLLLAMALVQFAVVFMRYVFGINYILMQESITYMHGAVFLLAAGYALIADDHVRVDIFYRDAPKKRKALADLLGAYLLLFPICLVLLWTASPYVANSWAVGEGSAEQSGIQGVYLLKSLIPAFAMLLAMAGFVTAARAGDALKGRD